MLGCYLLHFSLGWFKNNITLFKFHYASCENLVIFHFNSMGCLFDLTHPHLNPLIQTCNMACMGSFYPFPLCYVCCFPMFLMPCHGEYHSSPFCRSFYTGEHPQTLVQALAGAGTGRRWLVLARARELAGVGAGSGAGGLALARAWALARHPVTMPVPPQATHSTPTASLLLPHWARPLMMGVGLSWSPGPFVRVRSLMPAIFLAQVHLKLVPWACPYWWQVWAWVGAQAHSCWWKAPLLPMLAISMAQVHVGLAHLAILCLNKFLNL